MVRDKTQMPVQQKSYCRQWHGYQKAVNSSAKNKVIEYFMV